MVPAKKAKLPGSAAHVAPIARGNSLGLTQRDLNVLLDNFDELEKGKKNTKRGFVRWPFRKVSVTMKLIHPGRSESEFNVASRNISREGVSVLHNAYIHPGTKCAVSMPHPTNGPTWLPGTIMRCVHRGGMTHEAGIKFTEPINAREYVELDSLSDWFSLEKVQADKLTGTIVLVDDSEMDRRIVKHYLRETQLRLREAKNVDEALNLCLEGCDLLIVGYHLDKGTGADLIQQVRDKGIPTPAIVTTSDTSPQVRERLKQVRVNALLAKPIAQDILLRAVAEFLTQQQGAETLSTTLSPDDPASHLVNEFVESLRKCARKLESTIKDGDASVARTLSLQIKGSAPTLGFPTIAKLADEAAISLTRTASTLESAQQLRALITACDRARARSE
jgi:CheY-like chemotaxis protein